LRFDSRPLSIVQTEEEIRLLMNFTDSGGGASTGVGLLRVIKDASLLTEGVYSISDEEVSVGSVTDIVFTHKGLKTCLLHFRSGCIINVCDDFSGRIDFKELDALLKGILFDLSRIAIDGQDDTLRNGFPGENVTFDGPGDQVMDFALPSDIGRRTFTVNTQSTVLIDQSHVILVTGDVGGGFHALTGDVPIYILRTFKVRNGGDSLRISVQVVTYVGCWGTDVAGTFD